jgi:O-antigen/teichoic acid export membrane protein
MSPPVAADQMWGRDDGTVATITRNVGTKYLVIAIDAVIGLLVMPFNVSHLGQAAWGLWMLTSSLNAYFTVLDLGYGGSVTKFVAFYRARRDADSINEIISTLMAVFLAIGVVVYGAFVIAAFNVEHLFNLTPDQVHTARSLMLISGAQVAMGIPFGVFGGVMNGFQRYDINNFVSITTSMVVAVVNVAMLLAGYTLVELVFVTTIVRVLSNLVYRQNAYRVFPPLSVRLTRFSGARLREVSGFSAYVTILNWSTKLSYMSDVLIIGAFMSPAAVALWAVPRRLSLLVRSLTNQFNSVLLPVIVDLDARGKADRMRATFVQGTRLSLFAVLPAAGALFLLSDPLIPLYMGAGFAESIPVAQILAAVIAFRVGNSTANVVLKGAGDHRLLALTNAAMAIANLALSLVWIQRFGLIGQAFGTLIPVAAGSVLVLWPAACKRVGIGANEAFRFAVWPTLWPMAVMVPVVLALRGTLPSTLLAVVLAGAAGAVCYAATFFAFAISRDERTRIVAQGMALARWRRDAATVAWSRDAR